MFRFSRAARTYWAFFGLVCGVFGGHSSTIAEDAQTYLLRFKFSPGQEMHYITQNDAEYLIEQGENQQLLPHTSMNIRHYKVLDLNPEGFANVELVIDRARMSAITEGVLSLYDSRDAKHVPFEFQAVHQSIGKAVRAQLTPTGKTIPAPGSAADVEQYDLPFSLPEQPIAVGAIWKDTVEASVQIDPESKLFRPIKLQRRFELKSVENGIATISMLTVPITPLNHPFQESQLIHRKPSGTLKFEIEKGYLLDRQFQIDEKVVGHAGPGSALTVRISKVDRFVKAEDLKGINLTKPLVPVRVAVRPQPKS